ncbi:hypothetical protein QJS04_geneDACA006755 [Acorus gramineus]|uniref:Peptidase S49 domain-containing protein n=1 Tax=Acorus gramineus TaxID=55184 RepID=A0AAV9AWG6_ACOGR|nr:hypothetical protein QJS04_geneDACA006755 [Acorus gramineus]
MGWSVCCYWHSSATFSLIEMWCSNPSAETSATKDGGVNGGSVAASVEGGGGNGGIKTDYPTGEFAMEEFGPWRTFVVKLRMLFALPWERVRKGSVLSMKLKGEISDQLQSRFSSGLSLPQICENLVKAAYDPRIAGVYLQIEPLSCGWGKVEEIRRHILNFRKSGNGVGTPGNVTVHLSVNARQCKNAIDIENTPRLKPFNYLGKFIVGYVSICGEKEYYLACACGELYAPPSAYVSLFGLAVQATFLGGVFEKVGIEPQIQRIGKYKSAGDQLSRKNISEENREMLTSLLDNIYGNWVDTVSATQGKKREEIEEFLNSGVYQIERLKEEGWLTNLQYDDEVISMMKERLGQKKNLSMVDYRKYSKVRKWTLGLAGAKHQIAVIRASGSISRTRSPLSISSSGIISEKFIEKIRSVKDSKKYKAVIIRIDSPGGDALASDLMWREIKLLAASKPVIASMSDVAASGGYYMAMAADTIVAEELTLTGSIGVVTGKFSLGKLYERIGFNKEIISRGRFAELNAAEQRPFREATSLCRPDEAELFAKGAQNAYKQFRDKAASSRSMTVDQMEEVAQGRVWIAKDAASRGLVDALGGLSRAVAIAKQKANIPQDQQVRLVEVFRPSPTLLDVLTGMGNSVFGFESKMNEVLHELTSFNGVQARMDGIIFERLGGASMGNPILSLIKDYLGLF